MRKRNKLMYSSGINDADYPVVIRKMVNGKDKMVWICPYYLKWKDMLKRCYSAKCLEKRPTYKGCSVCNEWLLFSNFRAWMITQDWKDKHIDKDFLVEGGKVYSPSTCVFVPVRVNLFITVRGEMRGEYPIGVGRKKGLKKNPYYSHCNDDGVKYHLGMFPTPEQAHQAWLAKKLEVCNKYLEEFKDEPLIVQGLLRIHAKIQRHIETNTELTSF